MRFTDITFARQNLLLLLMAVPVVLALGWWLGVKRGELRKSVLLLRAFTVVCLVLTIAQPLLISGGDATNTIFVVDQSRSLSGNSATEIEQWVNAAIASGGGSNRAAVITFGSSPELAAPVDSADQIPENWSDSETDMEYTDIESALALARALPVGGSRRIVLVSDGAENLGAGINQAGQAATDGTPIDILTLPGVGGDDLRIEGASAPNAVWVGETVNVLASVATGSGGDGIVSLLVDGTTTVEQNATFVPGLNTYTFAVPDLTPGFHALTVQVAATTAPDVYSENNLVPLSIIVRDSPQLMLISPAGSDAGKLRGSFERKGAVVTLTEPEEVSSRISDLAVYDAFVLNNVSAQSLTFEQLSGLQEATRSLGKGLIVVGGNGSYGPGSYAGTILEETLPVTVKVTDGRERQRVALLLVIDKSGSMSYGAAGTATKIDMAKEAAKLAVGALADGDVVGVMAFSDGQQWLVTLTTIDGQATRDQISAAIDTMKAEGGTEIFPALQVGFAAIRNTDADVRHVVLLSDGKSRTGTLESYQQEIADAVADRTTLSTIAIGEDSDVELMTVLAEDGYGRFHFASSAEEIPRLTLQEAQSAGSQSVIRGTFHPIQTLPSPILIGFDPEDLPPLEGYDFAEAKPDAQVILTSERDDPLLAKWQYGLGRVVAWTGDDGSDFALQWTNWTRYDEFWANMVRWALPDPENRPINVEVERDGPEAVVNVSSTGINGDYVELASTTATIIGPDGARTEDIPFYQSGPGQYQFRIAAPQSGAYEIELSQQRGTETIAELSSFSMPPSPELQPNSNAIGLMNAIALVTGGRTLSLDDAGEVFASPDQPGEALPTYDPIWYFPLIVAFFALLTELALRYSFFNRLQGVIDDRRSAISFRTD